MLSKKKPKSKPADLVKLVAIARTASQIKSWGGVKMHVSTYTEHNIVVVCGWSSEPGDASNAFAMKKHLGSVIDQWVSLYGRGWMFELYDLEGRLFGKSETGHRWTTFEEITKAPVARADKPTVVRVDKSPLNTRIKIVQLSCGHELYVRPPARAPSVGRSTACDKCE
jgi:hypothetical protein